MKRIECIRTILNRLRGDEVIVSCNGVCSRELFSIDDRESNFYMIGAMGLSSSVALGICIAQPDKRILIMDGDGNVLMNLGALTTIGTYSPPGLLHVVFDNACYESTGGQPSNAEVVDLEAIAHSCGYRTTQTIRTMHELDQVLNGLAELKGPTFIRILVETSQEALPPRVGPPPDDIARRFEHALHRTIQQ